MCPSVGGHRYSYPLLKVVLSFATANVNMKFNIAPDTETPSCHLLSFLLLYTVVTGLWIHTTELDLVEKGMCLAY